MRSAKIVVCGAGIAGVAAAWQLMLHGAANVTLVEPGNPLSLTSDKSTEAYRNWWPGPDRAMTAFMDRSIDLIEGIARATDNRINLNRRGYVFATADSGKIDFLQDHGEDAPRRAAAARRASTTARDERLHALARARLRFRARRRGRDHRPEPDPANTSPICRPTRSRSPMRAAPAGSARSSSAP